MSWISPSPCPMPAPAPDLLPQDDVLRLHQIDIAAAARLLAEYGLTLALVEDGCDIPGSYWGDCEAGLIGETVYARRDTPVHSLLHEACHLIVLPPERRRAVHTDATDSVAEEDAVCVLQVLLGEQLPGVGSARILADMDRWGYTFRTGSARSYYEHDAEDAWQWLHARGLVGRGRQRISPPHSLPHCSNIGPTPMSTPRRRPK